MGDERIVVPLGPKGLGKEIREVDPEPEYACIQCPDGKPRA
jgi:hypothetical protein